MSVEVKIPFVEVISTVKSSVKNNKMAAAGHCAEQAKIGHQNEHTLVSSTMHGTRC